MNIRDLKAKIENIPDTVEVLIDDNGQYVSMVPNDVKWCALSCFTKPIIDEICKTHNVDANEIAGICTFKARKAKDK